MQLGSDFAPDSKIVLLTLLQIDGTTAMPRGAIAEGDQLLCLLLGGCPNPLPCL